MVENFYRALKPGGLLGIIDFDTRYDEPRSVYFERHHIRAQTVRDEVTRHHLNFLQNGPGFSIPGVMNSNQYFLLFQKPG
jgi:ubiquinone/menaquinone biosynthesis C-methylase UbiE